MPAMRIAMTDPWIFSQIGSREHFTIPAILENNARLEALFCDYWSRPHRLWEWIPHTGFRKLKERNHPDIPRTKVLDTGINRLLFDLSLTMKKASAWEALYLRNAWYQDWILKRIDTPENRLRYEETPGIFFSFSYAAEKLFHFFKERGWRLVLGQIDPGKLEEDLVLEEARQYPDYSGQLEQAPGKYWKHWKAECKLADEIWVNSDWSKEALVRQGIAESKIEVVPLAYQASTTEITPHRYPKAFDSQRPLRILFLGQINIRKGAHRLIEALQRVPDLPIELNFVGPLDIANSDRYHDPRIRFLGAVSRQETHRFFKESDLFFLPTLSDGFAITQLEAQAYKLPVIASRFCAPVVQDGVNGRVLQDLAIPTIAQLIEDCVAEPETLARWSDHSEVSKQFSVESLARKVLATGHASPG